MQIIERACEIKIRKRDYGFDSLFTVSNKHVNVYDVWY